MTKFKSLPKNARHYNLNGLPVGAIIYCPVSCNSYKIYRLGYNGYGVINLQTMINCYLDLQAFDSSCYSDTATTINT